MTPRNYGPPTKAMLLLISLLTIGIAGCEGDDGANGIDGTDGADGAAGAPGTDGQACWDLNNNGVGDPEEDINGDGVVDVYDCNAYASGAYEIDQLHAGYFTENAYEGTKSCLVCHGKLADEFLTTAHFKWEGDAANIVNVAPGTIHGKNDIINNFCVAVPSNEGRCTQCHAGYGYKDDTFDFGDPENIDCLVCHDQTDTYAKDLKTAGLPVPGIDLNAVARSVATHAPTIENCIDCHANAGGDDNVKHGDLAMAIANTTREYDVHMGTDGGDMDCVACHQVKRDNDDKMLSHGIGGMPYHSVDEGEMLQCTDCHEDLNSQHAGTSVDIVFQNNNHQRLACQVCHIPTFAREQSTKTEWYWEDAGQTIAEEDIPRDPVTNRAMYDKKKGSFVWETNVRPTLLFHDGTWNKMVIHDADTYTHDPDPSNPVVLGAPAADYTDDDAMIYPFKKMIGNQIADVVNKRIMVPHLFGPAGGPNPYWGKFDWDLALIDGANYTGQPYTSGNSGFVDTVMYLTVNHEVAPKEDAWGMNGDCGDCHLGGQIDWVGLGYDKDPADGGTRPE